MVEITYTINAREVTLMFLHRQRLRIVLYEDGRVDIKDERDGNNGKALTEIDITRDDWKEEGKKGGSLESLIESNLKTLGFEVKRDEEKRIVYAKKTVYSSEGDSPDTAHKNAWCACVGIRERLNRLLFKSDAIRHKRS